MNGLVIDSSVVVEILLRTTLGERLASVISGMRLIAHELIDAEVLSALRGNVLRRTLTESEAITALENLLNWPIKRVSNFGLTFDAWRYYQNVGPYDAFYLAVAHKNELPLITVDARLSRAPVADVAVINLR